MPNQTLQANNSLLSGVKVLDMSRILAGPWATQLLADYGATVWKIEKPQCGDDTRHWGPPYLTHDVHQLSAYFLSANRGKKSVAVDISRKVGQAVIKQLAQHADVVVENYKVGTLKKYGLDYLRLKAVNPRLIYCSISGFGQTGPMANRAGYDAMIQATGGLMSITGETDAEGGQPQKVGVAVTDLMTGMYATTAILAALHKRKETGAGDYIDLALLDTQIAMLANQGMNYLISGTPPTRQGNAHPNIVPYQTFCCSDGYFMLAVGNDAQFKSLCQVLNRSELVDDQRFATNSARVIHRNMLLPILQKLFLQQTCLDWIRQLEKVDVPCGGVNDVQQSFAHEQVKHRQMQIGLRSDIFGEIPQIANPVKFLNAKTESICPPPLLGADTLEVLSELLGFSQSELLQMRLDGHIA